MGFPRRPSLRSRFLCFLRNNHAVWPLAMDCFGAAIRAAGGWFSFARPKESHQRKGRPEATLRCAECPALLAVPGARLTRACGTQTQARLSPGPAAMLGAVYGTWVPSQNTSCFSPSPSRGGLGWGWGFNDGVIYPTREIPHPHPNLPPEGEGTSCSRILLCSQRYRPGSPLVQLSTAVILGRSARLFERSEFRARPKWRGAQGSPQGQTVGVSFLLNPFLWTSGNYPLKVCTPMKQWVTLLPYSNGYDRLVNRGRRVWGCINFTISSYGVAGSATL